MKNHNKNLLGQFTNDEEGNAKYQEIKKLLPKGTKVSRYGRGPRNGKSSSYNYNMSDNPPKFVAYAYRCLDIDEYGIRQYTPLNVTNILNKTNKKTSKKFVFHGDVNHFSKHYN